MFEERLGIPTALTNDANAAAIGEMTYGAARGMKDFIMITLGTGVGSGIVINGQMVYGHDGFAGELGHTIIRRENGRLCGCGRHGCLETYCSATGVARTAREFLTARTEPSLLRSFRPKTSPLRMCMMQPFRVTSWHRIFLTLPVLFWERLLQTSLLSPVPKQLFCSVGWLSPEITSSSYPESYR